jgi:hypothetical protein
LPPALAARFTVSELAVLKVVGEEVKHNGFCNRSMQEIAARAGCSLRRAQTAIRAAEALGLISVRERRVSATRNDTNIIVVISSEWRTWLRLVDKGGGGGFKKGRRTQFQDLGNQEKGRNSPRLSTRAATIEATSITPRKGVR